MLTLKQDWGELHASVRRFVGARVNDAHAADDIAQDVMLKVQAQLDRLPPEEKLPAWMMAVARNAVVDHYRSKTARTHDAIGSGDALADAQDAEQQDAGRELSACLTRMIERLPEPYREAMKLADIQALSQQELADRVGISLSGAKSRVQRARQQLREMILDCCNIERDARGNVVDYQTTPRTQRYCGDCESEK